MANSSIADRVGEALIVAGGLLVGVAILGVALAISTYLICSAISHVDCEMHPTSQRCIALDARSVRAGFLL